LLSVELLFQFFNERYFAAVGEERAPYAFAPDLVRQHFPFYLLILEPDEKVRLEGEGEHLVDAEVQGLLVAGKHHLRAQPFPVIVVRYGERFYFGKVFPGDMERAYADDFLLVFGDDVFLYVLVEVVERPGKHFFPFSVEGDHGVNRFDVAYFGRPYFHGGVSVSFLEAAFQKTKKGGYYRKKCPRRGRRIMSSRNTVVVMGAHSILFTERIAKFKGFLINGDQLRFFGEYFLARFLRARE